MSHSKGTVLVTGTNGGLGSAIVSKINASPELRAYHGIYTVRDATDATPNLDAALRKPPLSSTMTTSHSYDKLSLDLSLISNVRQTAKVINDRVAAHEIPPIRAAILNAGYQDFGTQTWTADGLDMAFTVNYLSHWLLVLLILQSMDRETGRIIWISSWSHNPSGKRFLPKSAYVEDKYREILHDDIRSIAEGTWSSNMNDETTWAAGLRRYGASKLLSVTTLYELQRRLDIDPILKNVSVLAVDPGAMATGIVRRSDSWVLRILLFRVLIPSLAPFLVRCSPNGSLRTRKKSAGDVLAAALNTGPLPLSKRPKGLYLDGSGLGEYNTEAKDPSKCGLVWRESILYTQLAAGETILEHWQ